MRDTIIRTANQREIGGFVSTDGAWCCTRNPQEFREFLEGLGFEVKTCVATKNSTAVATTADGYKITWNGYCKKI